MKRPNRIVEAGLPLALAAIALALRVATLRYKAAIIDELIELYIVTRPTWETFVNTLYDQRIQSPLHYSLAFLVARFAPSLTALRWISLSSGVGTVLAAYYIGRRLHSRMFGCLLGFLLAVSASHVLYSQTLRPYAFSAFFATLSFYYLFDLIEGKSRWKYAVVMTLCQTAYLHAVFIGLAQGLWVFWRKRGSLRVTALALTPSWLLLGSWYALSGNRLATDGGASSFRSAGIPSLPALIDMARAFCQQTDLSLVIYGALLACAMIACPLARRQKDNLLLGFMCLLLPLAAILGCHRYFHYSFHYRHALALLPIFLGLVAAPLAGVYQARIARRPSAQVVLGGLALFMFFELSLTAARTDISMQAVASRFLRESMEVLRDRVGSKDAVVFSNPNTAATVLYHFDRKSFDRLVGIEVQEGAMLFSLFRFPADLRLTTSRIPVFVLCSKFPAASTMDVERFKRLKSQVAAAQGRIWFVHSRFLNYFSEDAPFASALRIAPRDLVEAADGISWIRPSG